MMIKHFSALALVIALSACSSDSGSDPDSTTGGTTDGNNTTGGTTDGNGDGGSNAQPVVPSGDVEGAWFGDNNFGTGVMIVDASQNIYALTSSGTQHEVVFGPASQPLQRFIHRDSENAAFSDSFTTLGDLPSEFLGGMAADTVIYNLTAENDGQQISDSVSGFSMTFADENALPNFSLGDAAGTWVTTSSCLPEDCNLRLTFNISASGEVTGSTVVNDADPESIEGNVTAATGATQYLNIEFQWFERNYAGVLYRDRNDINRMILNTLGPDGEGTGNQSFTANLIRQ